MIHNFEGGGVLGLDDERAVFGGDGHDLGGLGLFGNLGPEKVFGRENTTILGGIEDKSRRGRGSSDFLETSSPGGGFGLIPRWFGGRVGWAR